MNHGALEEAFETTGEISVQIYELQLLAADIDNDTVSRSIERMRLATIMLGNTLALMKKGRPA